MKLVERWLVTIGIGLFGFGIGHAATTTSKKPNPVKPPQLKTIIVSPSQALVDWGNTQKFTAEGKDQNGQKMNLVLTEWKIDNTSVGKMDNSGLFTANGKQTGTAIITIQSGYIIGKATVTVKSSFCQCLQYVEHRTGFGPNPNSPAAMDYGHVLSLHGYSIKASPAVNDIVIFKRDYGSGIDATNGHIGYITNASYNSKGKYWQITIKSAHWTNTSVRDEYGCDNVEVSKQLNVDTKIKQSNIEYWRK